jgi:hypothetical protein
MKRWHIRTGLVYLLVCAVPAYILAYNKLPLFWRFAIPLALGIAILLFGHYDLRTDFEEDDPARKDLEEDMRDVDEDP